MHLTAESLALSYLESISDRKVNFDILSLVVLGKNYHSNMQPIQLVKSNVEKPKLIRGDSYMAFVKVTPFYEEGNPMPKLLKFNELIPKKQKEEFKEDKQLFSTIRQEEEL